MGRRSNNENETNKHNQIIFIIAAAVLLIGAIAFLTLFFRNKKGNDGVPDKDAVLLDLWNKDIIVAGYDGKDIVVSNKDIVFEMLRSAKWTPLSEAPEHSEAAIVFRVDENCRVELFDPSGAAVVYGEERCYYVTPPDVTSDLRGYFDDNTTISAEDAFTFLAVSDSVRIEMLGASCTVSDSSKIVSALNPAGWKESERSEPSDEPLIRIGNENGLSVCLYDSSDLGVIDYSGTRTVYEIDPITAPSVALVAKSYLNDIAKNLISVMDTAENVIISSSGKEYRLSLGSALTSLLSIPSWERMFKEPDNLPEKCDISVYDEKSFMLRLYKEASVAEYENIFFTVPETVFTAVGEYVSEDSQKEESVELRSLISSKILENKKINASFGGTERYISVKNDLITVLNMSSWTEDNRLSVKSDSGIRLTVSESPEFSIVIGKSAAMLTVDKETRKFKIADTVQPALEKYIDANIHLDSWAISASELGSLQKSADSAEITVYYDNSNMEKYADNTSGTVALLAALNLVPVDQKPTDLSDERTEILFRGTDKFSMTLRHDDKGTLYVNVVGTIYSMGKTIDRWFLADKTDYKTVSGSLRSLNEKSFDIVAARFVESLRTCDIDTFNELTGNTSFDYSGIMTVMLNDISIEKASEYGVYTLNLNVEEQCDSPFEKGIGKYVLVIGTNGTKTVIKTLAPADKYDVFSKNSAAASAVDSFTTWTGLRGVSFDSVDKIENRAAVVNYLMVTVHRIGLGTASEDGSVFTFTIDEIKDAAKEFFGLDNFSAEDTPAFNKETGLYSYYGSSVSVSYKRVSDEKTTGDTTKITYEWYSDPLCLFATEKVVYTLKKNASGGYMILSASDDIGKENLKNPSDLKPKEENSTNPSEEKIDPPSDEKSEGSSGDEQQKPSEQEQQTEKPADEKEPSQESDENPKEDIFTVPVGLSPTETVFKYFEYINEKNVEKTESLLVEIYRGNDYSFDTLTKISVASCAEISVNFEWYEPWYKNPYAYTCVAATVNVECVDSSWRTLAKGENKVELYLVKETEESDWRIVRTAHGGEGLLG